MHGLYLKNDILENQLLIGYYNIFFKKVYVYYILFYKYKKNYMNLNPNNNKVKKVYLNHDIKAFNILLLDENWKQIGTFPRKEALAKAQEQWLDLIQVWYNPKDKISTCKILDYWKYQYNLKKKEKDKKKSQKVKGIKEIKISYWIGKEDLKVKIKKAYKLLETWYNVKFILRLRWRENIHKTDALAHMENIVLETKTEYKNTWIKEEEKWYSLMLIGK